MKNTRILTGLVAATLLLAQTSTVFAAPASTDGSLTGDGTLEAVTYAVNVPINLDFAIDPFEVKAPAVLPGSQLSGTSYQISNLTEAPVKVTLDFTVTTATGVTLVDDKTTLSPDDDKVTDKNLYMAVIGAKTIDDNVFTTVTYDPTAADTLVPINAADKKASVAFALAKSSDGTNLAAGDDAVASFTYYGVMNSYAAWANNDVTVAANYKLTALRPDTYTELSTNAVGTNQIKAGPTTPGFGAGVGTPAPDGKSVAITLSKATQVNTDLVIPFNPAGGAVSAVKISSPASVALVAGTDYVVGANSITIKSARLSKLSGSSYSFAATLGGTTGGTANGTYTINLTLTA